MTQLPFQQLLRNAAEAGTFDNFPASLLSVGKLADDGNVLCKGDAILIGKGDERGRYRIPLVQHRDQWQPRKPTKRANKFLQQTNNVYDLPSTEEAIKWMHAVCGYPVKSTWIKSVKAGNYTGWPMLNERNIKKY